MRDAQENPSSWQQRIEGEWHGTPSVFDAEGNHSGFIKVNRSSVFDGGRTTYYMNTELDVRGPLRARFEAEKFAFGVMDGERDRIYLGPDFVGAGHPYGALVDAHYYSPGWTADLRTMVHVLPDGKTQVYSSQLFDGPCLTAVFNGLYKHSKGGSTNADERPAIERFLDSERKRGPGSHVLPMKQSGTFRGELEVWNADQKKIGTEQVIIRYRPLSLLRSAMEYSLSGVVDTRFELVRSRNGVRHAYEGPDVFGNAMAFGRAAFTSQHFMGKALKIRGREFIIDDACTLSVVWQWFQSDHRTHTMFGVLAFQPDDEAPKKR